MTVQEAIETIKYASAFNRDDSPLIAALDMTIEALEKQIPMKPIITIASEEVEYMKCLGCGLTTVLYHGMRPNYCGNCGQKLRWD